MGFSRPEFWSGEPFPPPGDLPDPGIELRQILYQLSQQGSPGKNTGVSSLSLLQQIFLIQESNRGLLHWGRILFQLSYQGSP